ncbi:MAG: hypothetical protein PF444_07175, partial [Bacteroidales bacterium]|nr:hypothetical protein [Bacteroidales bacterium]
MDSLFNDTKDSSDRSRESKVLNLLPSRFKDVSELEAFVLAVMSVCGAIRGKSNVYDLVILVARYYPPIDHKCLDNKVLKAVVDRLLRLRMIDIISNDYVVTSDSILGVPHKALSDVELEQAMLAAFEREHYTYSWSIPKHVERFCLLTKRKCIGNAQLDLTGHSGGLRELLSLIQEQKDLSFVDLMFYQSVNFDEVSQITSFIINNFSEDDQFVAKAVQWFLDMDTTAKRYAFYPLVSYLALCATPEQIEIVTNSFGEHLRPQYKNLVAISFVADMLRGDLNLARQKAELFKNAWHD